MVGRPWRLGRAESRSHDGPRARGPVRARGAPSVRARGAPSDSPAAAAAIAMIMRDVEEQWRRSAITRPSRRWASESGRIKRGLLTRIVTVADSFSERLAGAGRIKVGHHDPSHGRVPELTQLYSALTVTEGAVSSPNLKKLEAVTVVCRWHIQEPPPRRD
jgi:hypothetical protein